MSVNLYKPHIAVLPEDDANRQIAVGFELHTKLHGRCFEILRPAGGWAKVLASFKDDKLNELKKYPHRHLVLLFDFDEKVEERRERFQREIPLDVQDRVFLLGTQTEPEELRKTQGKSLEDIGKLLAEECYQGESDCWASPLLDHNREERLRLNQKVKGFLFKT